MADCINCGTATAVMSYGATIEAQNSSTNAWVLICGVTGINGPTSQRGEIDVTTLCSTAKENALDLPDYGTIELSGLLLDGNEGQILLDALFMSAEKTNFRMTTPDDGYGNGAVVRTFEARVQSQPVTVALSDALRVTFTLRVTGPVDKTLPTGLGARLIYNPTVLSESAENDGTVAGVVSVILTSGTFAEPLTGVTFTGVPAGLTAVSTRVTHNTMTISFSGTATTSDAGTSASVGVTFADAAFDGATAADVSGATGRSITIRFV